MATTGFWPIKGRLKDAIDYAENPDKTTDRKYLDEDLYSALRYAGKMDGLQLTFAIFTELLKICTGNNLLAENKHLPLSPLLREEVRKLDKYIEDYKLLCDCHIDTAEELFSFREDIDAQIEELKQEREHIRNKIRRAPESEKPELKLQAKAVTQKMDPLRKQQRIAKRIAERTERRKSACP